MSTEMATLDVYFAANVRRYMEDRGWNQAELAKRCGWPQPRISEILKQKYNPRLETVERVAAAFEVNAGALLLPPPEKSPQAQLTG